MALTGLAAAAATALLLSGLLLAVAGLRRVPVRPPGPARTPSRLMDRYTKLSPRTRVLILVGAAAGVLIAVLTGWILAIVVLPVAAAGIPWLLTPPESAARVDRLEAMEEWTRSLAGIIGAGVSLENALMAAMNSTPAPIRPQVTTLVARLNARWSTDAALLAFADDLNDATGDVIAANLILAAKRRGAGLSQVLIGLSQSVAADVRARRAIEADRAKPRTTARWITIITIVVLTLFALNSTYIAPYGTPLGQLVLAALLAAYVALLAWLRTMAKGQPAPRFLNADPAKLRTTRSVSSAATAGIPSGSNR